MVYVFAGNQGGDMYGVGAYYLFSPYNLLFYFFDEQNLYAGVLVVLLLKIGSMGLTMNLYLQRKNASGKPYSFPLHMPVLPLWRDIFIILCGWMH